MRQPIGRSRTVLFLWVITAGALICCSCATGAKVELAAADSLETLADALTKTMTEYHAEVEQSDDQREHAAVEALLNRLRDDIADDAETNRHVAAFKQALQRIRADRRVEWQRFWDSTENISLLRELATGMRRLALDSLSLEDETRRYVNELVEIVRTRREASETEAAWP